MTMNAIIPATAGGPEVLKLVEREVPQPGPGQVLLRVAAAGINRHDCNQRARGHGPAGSTDVLGLEVSGEVAEVGPDVDASWAGRRVAALIDGGGYAGYALADVPFLFDWPDDLSAVEAAALPEALFTLQLNLVELGALQPGEWLLIHGGTSGIGMAGIPFARQRGVHVAITAGSDEKCARALKQGAEVAINYRTQDFVEEVRAATDGTGVDAILDTVGGLYAQRNLQALAPDGRLMHLSPAGPDFTVPLSDIMSRRARVTGALLRAYPDARKARLAEALRAETWPLVTGPLRPVIDSTFALADAAAAHRRMDEGGHIGKVVLTVA